MKCLWLCCFFLLQLCVCSFSGFLVSPSHWLPTHGRRCLLIFFCFIVFRWPLCSWSILRSTLMSWTSDLTLIGRWYILDFSTSLQWGAPHFSAWSGKWRRQPVVQAWLWDGVDKSESRPRCCLTDSRALLLSKTETTPFHPYLQKWPLHSLHSKISSGIIPWGTKTPHQKAEWEF